VAGADIRLRQQLWNLRARPFAELATSDRAHEKEELFLTKLNTHNLCSMPWTSVAAACNDKEWLCTSGT